MSDITPAINGSTAEFRRLGERLWGYGWQTKASRHFEVTSRTVRNWAAGARTVPDSIMAEMQAMASIAPPPDTTSEEDRDDACRLALEPGLTELRNRAIGAGWHPAEIAAAMLSLTIDEIRNGAGDDAARAVLRDTLAQI